MFSITVFLFMLQKLLLKVSRPGVKQSLPKKAGQQYIAVKALLRLHERVIFGEFFFVKNSFSFSFFLMGDAHGIWIELWKSP